MFSRELDYQEGITLLNDYFHGDCTANTRLLSDLGMGRDVTGLLPFQKTLIIVIIEL